MRKRKIKLTAVLVLFAMMLTVLPQMSFAVTWQHQETPPEFESIIFQNDGTSSDGVTGVFSLSKDTSGNECLSIGNASIVRQMFFGVNKGDGTPLLNDQGQCMISFDICAKQTNRAIVLLIEDSKHDASYAPFVMSGGGKMYYNEAAGYPSATYLPENARPYEANTWYNIKMSIYTHEQYIDFYVNDEFWGRNDVKRAYWFNNLYDESLTLGSVFFNYQPDWGLDEDGNVTAADVSGEILIDNFTYGIPVKRDIEVDFWKTEAGNIYDCEDVNVGCEIINRAAEDEKYTFTYEIRNDKNKLIKQGSDIYDLKAGQSKSVTMLDYAPEYGFFAVDAKLYNSQGELVVRDSTRFSIISHQDGINERMGACVHNVGHGDGAYGALEDTIKVLEKLGIGYLRDDHTWLGFYKTDGETRANQAFMDKVNRLDTESPVNRLVIVRTLPEAYSMVYDENSETVKDFLNRWGKYCYNLASDSADDTIYYEIENEWWLKGTVGVSGVVYDQGSISSDIQLYAEMYKIASKQIRAANPNAKIVGFNFSHLNPEWLKAVLEALGDNPEQYFDILAIHDYMASFNGQYPEQYLYDGDPSRGISGLNPWMEYLKELGLDDKPLWSTEFGTTSGYHKYDVDEKLNADYYVRHFMLDTLYMDKMFIYQLQKDVSPTSEYEGGFGIVRQGSIGEIKREALPAAIQFAAYNTLLKGSEFVSKQIIGTDGTIQDSTDIYINKHKTADGKDCYAIFNATSEKIVSFDFGVDSAKVYDEYGNETTISALDGYITLNVTTAPTYVIADDLKEEVTVRETPLFSIPQSVSTAVEDTFSFEVSKDTDAEMDISLDCSVNIEMSWMDSFLDNVSKIDFVTYNDRQKIENYKFDDGENKEEVTVSIGKNNKVYFKAPVKVRYIASLESNMRIMPYRSGRWQAIIGLKNNKKTSPLSGQIQISTGDTAEINNLLSGQKGTIRFNIPEDVEKKEYTVDAQIILDNGDTITESATTNFISVERTYSPPTLDGKIDAGEWKNSGTLIKFNEDAQYKKINVHAVGVPDWGGAEDLSGEAYLMYDEKYFYFAAKVQDNIHCGTDEQNRIWAMDSIQLGVSEEQKNTSNYTEIGIALGDNGESLIEKYHDANQNDPYFDKTTMNVFDEDTVVKVVRDGNYTTYELRIPWTELTVSGERPPEFLVFSTLINENDGKGRTAFMEWASGIGSGKNPGAFALIPFNY